MTVNELRPAAQAAPEPRTGGARHWLGLVMAAADAAIVFAVAATVAFAFYLQDSGNFAGERSVLEPATMLAMIFVLVNVLRGRYVIGNYLSARGQIAAAFTAWNIGMATFLALLVLAGISERYSRLALVATYLGGIPVIGLGRAALAEALSSASRAGRIAAERIFLIGSEAEVMAFSQQHQPWNLGFSVVDVALLRPPMEQQSEADAAAALAADLAAAMASCRMRQPDSVFIALPWSDPKRIDACIDAFMNLPVAIRLTPGRIMQRFDTARIDRTGPLASLCLTRPPLSSAEIAMKRAFDIAAASAILLAAMPLLLLVAALIRLDSPGPVLFRQRRYGFNRQPFRIFKFRTMTVTDDGPVIVQATRDDPRITRLGRFLRRTNLDELPQLLNVLAGDMSLVGPRPHALAHDHEFERKIARYARRHNMKPGITGWAQVNGLRGETDTDEKMEQRVAFDHWYIDNWSFGLDIAILLRTVLSRKAFANAG